MHRPPSPLLSPARVQRPTASRRRRPVEPWRRLAQHSAVLELCARLGIHSCLALVGAVSLAHLVPHLQTQAQELDAVREELALAETVDARLRQDFGRYFDPAQGERVIEEQTGYRSRSERRIVWTD